MAFVFCGAVHAVACRAYAIRPYDFRKTQINCHFLNTPKTTWDMKKTMSHVGKIMSDVIQTTSDLFPAVANV